MKASRAYGVMIALLFFSAFALKMLFDSGAFKEIKPHFQGSCRAIPGVAGPEDVEYFPAAHSLIISSDHRPEFAGQGVMAGALYEFDLSPEGAGPKLLATDLGADFHPHGIAGWSGGGVSRLWAINHRGDRTTVEVFDYSPGKLLHRVTLESPLLENANDLVATGPDSFYVTSDHGFPSVLISKMEDFSRIGLGYVSEFTGQRFSLVQRRIRYANGVALSLDHQRLFVAAMLGRAVQVYHREVGGGLHFEREIPLGTAPDNLMMDEEGVLWVGAHPKLLTLKKHSQNHQIPSPAQVLRITHPESENAQVEEVFLDGGGQISATSVAFHQKNRLILGSIFGDHLLDCRSSTSL